MYNQTQYLNLIPLNYLHLPNFLSPEENRELYLHILLQEEHFRRSVVLGTAEKHRRSRYLAKEYYLKYFKVIEARITVRLEEILDYLGISNFRVSNFESQCTSSNQGDYYRLHNDAGMPLVAKRTLTYVYYFSRLPLPFTGGELEIYETDPQIADTERYLGVKSAGKFLKTTLTPTNNSIVFFNSRLTHQVLPVQCPSGKFEDSRFTINGWLSR